MNQQISDKEVWQRGPINDVPLLLQPVAHTLLQASEEVAVVMKNFPDKLLWETPAGMASAAFHLQHIAGVIDRLFTYAKGKPLSQEQLEALVAEGKQTVGIDTNQLVNHFQNQVENAIAELKILNEQTLTEFRGIGRAQLPSTVIGLLFHSAEHTMRHLGQLIVTVKVLKAGSEK